MKRNLIRLAFSLGLVLTGFIPTPVKAEQSLEAIKDALAEINEQLTALRDLQNDKSLMYRRHMHRVLLALMQDQIDDAQKSGNLDRVHTLKNEMVLLTQERDATWDESIAILDAEYKRDELLAEQKILTFKIQAKHLEETNAKRAKALEEAADAWTKYKPLIEQRYELSKQLVAARQKEDYKTANDLYGKLKDIRAQMRAIEKDTSKQILQLEENKTGGDDALSL